MGLVDPLVRLLAAPPRWVGGQIHAALVGEGAVLDVTVDGEGDLRARERFRQRLREAGTDPGIAAVLLRLREPPGGWSTCQDLRGVMAELRQRGRKVYVFLESAGNAEMAVASAADRVFLVPTGEVGLVGVGVELTFFGSALARFGVVPDFEAAGAYKAFGEPFTRSFPSPANQEAMRELVDDLHAQLVDAVAEGRGRTPDEVRAALASAPLSAEQAVAAGLVDELLYEDQLLDWLDRHHGGAPADATPDPADAPAPATKGKKPARKKAEATVVPFGSWALRRRVLEILDGLGAPEKRLAVLHLEGSIALDGTGRGLVARQVLPVLKRLREDDAVAAVVLHVDSPGGSALASDLMWREVAELGRKKPVVAAFGDVSASGGFYLAAPARQIFARPGTLTGSIGVFGGKLVVADALRSAGVHTHPIVAAPNATALSATRPFTPDQRVRFKAHLQRFYDGFVGRVAAGRGRPVEDVEPHCRGRVWTGRAALERGLVDGLGGLDAAIARAAELADLHRWRRVDVAGRDEPLLSRVAQALVGRLVPGAVTRLAASLLPPNARLAAEHPNEPLALLPFDLTIR